MARAQRAEHAEVRHVAAREQQRALAAREGRELGFERVMLEDCGRSPDAPRRRRSRAAACTRRRLDQRRVRAQAQIVVAAEIQQLAAIDTYALGLRRGRVASTVSRAAALVARLERLELAAQSIGIKPHP
jgi:hypothetical protein